jgi:predicted DNA-binding transcriptional regulator AlpA
MSSVCSSAVGRTHRCTHHAPITHPAIFQKVLPFQGGAFRGGREHNSNMATPRPQFDALEPSELLTIGEVLARAKMKSSWLYELIKRGEFPAAIHLGGSKWLRAEVDEAIAQRVEERNREHGQNKFFPRARVFPFQPNGAGNAPLSVAAVMESATANESTLRVLSPELCDALRTLRIDIPELYLDEDSWRVDLLIMKVERKAAPQFKKQQKRKDTMKEANRRR